jgi:hypothetical protein
MKKGKAMRRLVSLWLLVYLGVSIVSLSAGFNFSHKDSTVRIGSSKFIINKQIQNWNGTLDHSGSIVGLPISFSNGILTANGTSAIMTGTYDGDSPRKVTFNSGHLLRVLTRELFFS